MMPAAIPVPYQHVDRVLPIAAPFLHKAAQRSHGWRRGEVEQRIRDKRASLWVVLDANVMIGAAMVELHDDGVYVALVGGHRWHEWRDQIKRVEEWAAATGRKCVKIDGRRGWARLMKRDGYAMRNGMLVKDV